MINYSEKNMIENKHGVIFAVEDLSDYLRIPKSTIYKLAREGKFPAQKIGRHWRFSKDAIDRWLEQT